MTSQSIRIFLLHGKDSSPLSIKMQRLSAIAQHYGFITEIPDFSQIADPDQRVELLLELANRATERLIFAGSSMGGYMAAIAAEKLACEGLFVMAPAFYMKPYLNQEPKPQTTNITIIHGWHDEIIPVDHSIKFAKEFNALLHLVNDDHRLLNQLKLIDDLWKIFLTNISQLNTNQNKNIDLV